MRPDQIFQALTFGEYGQYKPSLKLDAYGSCMASAPLDTVDGVFLCGDLHAHTPRGFDAALLDLWAILMEKPATTVYRVRGPEPPQYVRWTGYMWRDVTAERLAHVAAEREAPMRPDLLDIALSTVPRHKADSAVEAEAHQRLTDLVRAGVELETFGRGESIPIERARDATIEYALEVFADEVKAWANRETAGFADWLLLPTRSREHVVFQTMTDDPEFADEWVIEYFIEVDREGIRVDGGDMARVDGRAMERKAVSA